MSDSEIGLIGLGVMGKNLALNLANKGAAVSVYNREIPGAEENIAADFVSVNSDLNVTGFNKISEFVNSLSRPRTILLMVTAGDAVDSVIDLLSPLLAADDLVIDGGNSFFKDTVKRESRLTNDKILFAGAGISGGELGARTGCSMMFGGTRYAYERAEKYLAMISAPDNHGKPCYSYCGSGGAGHFVKMVHNGIEYAEMQLIAESFYFLKRCLNKDNEDIALIFDDWQNTDQQSYLLGITIEIIRKKEGGRYLIDDVLDVAGQKGTGTWSTLTALELGVPLDTIAASVMTRSLSALKTARISASDLYMMDPQHVDKKTDITCKALMHAFAAARIINHAIGFDLLNKAGQYYEWDMDLAEIARTWTGGCIIKSQLMVELSQVLAENKDINLLNYPEIVGRLKAQRNELAESVSVGIQNGVALPVMSAAINYLNGFTSGCSTAGLIQLQRDYFGAHGYNRLDSPLEEIFHTNWNEVEGVFNDSQLCSSDTGG